jgi:hypothetical protein
LNIRHKIYSIEEPEWIGQFLDRATKPRSL